MAASEKVLSNLHKKLTEVLIDALKGTETESYIDPDTGDEIAGTVIPASAAVMTVAAKFLKDNGITCAPAEDNEMGELERIMAARQRKLRQVDGADAAAVRDSIGYMGTA